MIPSEQVLAFKCKGCTERYLGCHDHCEKYVEGKKEYAAIDRFIDGDKDLKAYVKTSVDRNRHVDTKPRFLRKPKVK